jgi:hypothetical protein
MKIINQSYHYQRTNAGYWVGRKYISIVPLLIKLRNKGMTYRQIVAYMNDKKKIKISYGSVYNYINNYKDEYVEVSKNFPENLSARVMEKAYNIRQDAEIVSNHGKNDLTAYVTGEHGKYIALFRDDYHACSCAYGKKQTQGKIPGDKMCSHRLATFWKRHENRVEFEESIDELLDYSEDVEKNNIIPEDLDDILAVI